MPLSLKQLRDKADEKLVTFWNALQTKQDAYFAKHGKYFQCLISPENLVQDGVDSDFVARVPSDELYVIDRDFSFSEKIPFQIQIDEKIGPDGAEYSATVWVQTFQGDIYTRSRDNLQNDTGWNLYVEDELNL